MKKIISIIGLGNIGFRYLEAIKSLSCLKKIYIVEPNKETLIQRISQFELINKIKIFSRNELPKEILKSDLIIISTTSGPRFDIISELIKKNYKGKLLLEKFLYPDFKTLLKAEHIFDNYPSEVFVNQWMRSTELIRIFDDFEKGEILIKGNGIGILCNFVHYIDLITGQLCIDDFVFDKKKSNISEIIFSKRDGYHEIKGSLTWNSKNKDISFTIADNGDLKNNNQREILFEVNNSLNKNSFTYSGTNLVNNIDKKVFNVPYLSELAKKTIYLILNNEEPLVPTYEISLSHHKMLFTALENLLGSKKVSYLRIT